MLAAAVLAVGSWSVSPTFAEEEESSVSGERHEDREEREPPKEEVKAELKEEPREAPKAEQQDEPKQEVQEAPKAEKEETPEPVAEQESESDDDGETSSQDDGGEASQDGDGESDRDDEKEDDESGDSEDEKPDEGEHKPADGDGEPDDPDAAHTPDPEETPDPENTPDPEETPDPTEAADETPEPEETNDEATIDLDGPSGKSLYPGQSVRFSFTVKNAASLHYRLTGPDGELVASGELSVDAESYSFMPEKSGTYTLLLTAIGEDGSDVGAQASVTVAPLPALSVAVSAEAECCHGGDSVSFAIRIPEGVELASCTIKGTQSGNVFYEDDQISEKVTVIPPAVGRVTDVTLTVSVTDVFGRTAEDSATIPCAVHDRESRAQWEATMDDVVLTGVWPDDLIAIAKTQVGYKESSIDFGEKHGGGISGYTRYGDWAGMPYDEWCAMFASFCLHYAGVSESDFPRASNCQRWIEKLKKQGLYADKYSAEPQLGDLVFFEWEGDDDSDHVGIIVKLDGDGQGFTTIEGNSKGGAVTGDDHYDVSDARVIGYGLVNEAYARSIPGVRQTLVAQDGGMTITADVPADAMLKGSVRLEVDLIGRSDDRFEDCVEALRDELGGDELGWARCIRVRFVDSEGNRVKPQVPVTLTVDYSEKLAASVTLTPAVATIGADVDIDRHVTLTRRGSACRFEFEQSDFDGIICTYVAGDMRYGSNVMKVKGDGNTLRLACTAASKVPAGAALSLKEIKPGSGAYNRYLSQIDVGLNETVRFFEVKLSYNGMTVEPEGHLTLSLNCAQDASAARVAHLDSGRVRNARLSHRKNGRVVVDFDANGVGVFGVVFS